ncbi:fungal-specific transcription factor domain-containing protein [Microdochium trichocladiopsis]|uniref:Fungal-specific transcription factor domain-containing protein n=1 Tax=Microdochium trichocladiopsis TaxID=1682393 RepID=A0A9P9BUU3_9PEZI|nr:fungal-specific transcription factor domain-containing protein [Microdochium trichocladiopsis]KAH7039583.1 fungal-specific transcription factor domain-containing protein [Microdochium trichocladiopsis]
MSDTSPSAGPVSKRKRTALACNVCRSRKSRCNGARPQCSMCSAAGFECIYETSDSATNIIVQKEYVVGLSDRVQALEAAIAKHNKAIQDHETRLQSVEPRGQRTRTFDDDHPGPAELGQTPVSIASADNQEAPSEERVTDGMVISFVSEADTGHFGPSSNIALLGHISQAVSSLANSHDIPSSGVMENWARIDSGIINTTRRASPENSTADNGLRIHHGNPSPYVLPSEAVTRELMRQYFSNTGLLYPYIHEPTFVKEYDDLVANGFKKARRPWLALLHMILAMSSSTLVVDTKEERQQRNAESLLFYKRAARLCDSQETRGTSLETVQYLLLACHYLQGTQSSVQTWSTHGLAVKAALSLGLHSINASKDFSRHNQELRKRAWYGCVVLDRMLSLTFGRPAIIPRHFIRLPLPEDFAGLDTNNGPTSALLLSAQFFGGTMATVMLTQTSSTLMNVLHEVIADLYGDNLGCDPPLEEGEMLTRVFRLDRALGQWELDLPPGLSLLQPGDLTQLDPSDTVHLRFRTILTLRKLNLETLIHRPALVQTVDTLRRSPGSNIGAPKSLQSMRQSSINSCVTAAESIISIIHQTTTGDGPRKRLLGAWWFSLYYVFNASLILFTNLLMAMQGGQVDRSAALQRCDEYLLMAVEALRNLDAGNMVIKICNHRLSQLRQLLLSWSKSTPFHPAPLLANARLYCRR